MNQKKMKEIGQMKNEVIFPYKDTPAYDRMKKFLSSYVTCKKACETYESECECGLIKKVEKEYREAFINECRERCRAIEEFLSSIDLDRDERQLFSLHYINGLSIESASEQMYVSRSTVFRINKRAEYKAFLRFLSLDTNDHVEARKCIS